MRKKKEVTLLPVFLASTNRKLSQLMELHVNPGNKSPSILLRRNFAHTRKGALSLDPDKIGKLHRFIKTRNKVLFPSFRFVVNKRPKNTPPSKKVKSNNLKDLGRGTIAVEKNTALATIIPPKAAGLLKISIPLRSGTELSLDNLDLALILGRDLRLNKNRKE